MKKIIDFSNIEARRYFLKEESYFNFDLPKYFKFQSVIDKVDKKIDGKLISDFYNNYFDTDSSKNKATFPCDYENVNYKFLNNKDGKFAWRPLQLIHPALYVSLVHKITEPDNWNAIVKRFQEFCENPKIRCYSIPIESETILSDKATTVNQWWQSIEQQSIELALNYEYILHTDITDCYGSIYTHSIAWALHTKSIAKNDRRKNSLIGNTIDKHLQDMSYGQTNGIPQGSVLMDFIAEMVLGYADLELCEKLKNESIGDYHIIRYRDDYRVFSNNPQDAELIIKLITEILIDLGMMLNAQKTLVSNNVVRDSIKPDKLFWMTSKNESDNLQEQLFIIHELANKYPNSGSLSKALNKFYDKIQNIEIATQNVQILISIIVDIAYKNPRTYPITAAILSKLLSIIETAEIRENLLNSITKRFDKIPNTGHIKIWLQRITLKVDRDREYEEILCKKVNDKSIPIWNSDWLNSDLATIIENEFIVDEEIIDEIDNVVNIDEVQLFDTKTYYAR